METQRRKRMGCIVLWFFWLACFLVAFVVVDLIEAWIALVGFIIQSACLLIFIWIRSHIGYQAMWLRYLSLWLVFFLPHFFVALLLSIVYGFPKLLTSFLSLILSIVTTIGSLVVSHRFDWNILFNEE